MNQDNQIFNSFINTIVEKICLAIIIGGVYLLTFTSLLISGEFFFPFVALKALFFMGVVDIIFATYLILALSFPKYRPRVNILSISLLAFIGFSVISAVFGKDLFNSFWSKYERMTGLLVWFHLLAFFLVLYSVFKRKKDWIKIFTVSLIPYIIVSILSIMPKAGWGSPLEKYGFATKGGATLGNSSFLATYLLFGAFISLYLLINSFQEKKHIIARTFYGASFFIIIASLYYSTGRAATIAFFAGIIVLFLLKLIFQEKGFLKLAGKILLIILSLSFVVTIFFAAQPEDNAVKRVLAEKFSIASKDRILVWGIGIEGWKESPVLGWGPENFELAFTKYFKPVIFLQEEYGADLWYDRAHNIIVDMLVSRGIIGLLLYLGIFASVFWILFKKFKENKIEFLTFGIFSVVLISYFIQNLTVFDMIGSLLMFFLILGFVGSLDNKEIEERKEGVFRSWFALAGIAVLIPSLFYFVVQPARMNHRFIESMRLGAFESKERVKLFDEALEISPCGRYQVREYMDQFTIRLKDRDFAETIPVENQRIEMDFVAGELEKNISENPLRYSSYLKLGKLYNTYARLDLSKLDRSEEVLSKAIEVGPGNQQAYWILTQTYLFKQDFYKAAEISQQAIDLEPRVLYSHIIAMEVGKIISQFAGDNSVLEQKINQALSVNPEWENDLRSVLQR